MYDTPWFFSMMAVKKAYAPDYGDLIARPLVRTLWVMLEGLKYRSCNLSAKDLRLCTARDASRLTTQ
jgi:hypothetical protein